MMKRFLFLLSLMVCSTAFATQNLRIGLLDSYQSPAHDQFIEESLATLRHALPDMQLITQVLRENEMAEAVRSGRVQAVIASADVYRELLPSGLRDIANLLVESSSDASRQYGVAILVRADRSDLETPEAISRLQRIAFLERSTFSERIFWTETKQQGQDVIVNPNIATQYVHNEQEALELLWLRRIDAVVLPSCSLERFARNSDLDTGWARAINLKSGSELACQNSSRLYPGTVFALSADVTPDLLMRISQILFTLPSSNGIRWSVANDYRSTDRLLRTLGLDEFSQQRRFDLRLLYNQYKPWVLGGIGGLLLLCLHSILLSRLVKHRTKQLSEALDRERILREEARHASDRISRMQRIGIVGQMSSLFAHEVRQPLSALQCYLYVLKRHLSEAPGNLPHMNETRLCLDNIEKQADWIGNVVEKVHGFLKNRNTKKASWSWEAITDSAIKTFEMTSTSQSDHWIVVHPENQEMTVFCEKMDLELTLINLFRNAVEAKNTSRQCRIDVAYEKYEHGSRCIVSDNGDPIDATTLEKLSHVQTSSAKPQGLGLGLSIVRFLVEQNGGHVDFLNSKTGGLAVVLSLPKAEASSASEQNSKSLRELT